MSPTVTVNGQPVPELVDARLTSGQKTLILFIKDQGVFTTRRINMRRQGAGLFSINPRAGTVMFTRGVKCVSEQEDSFIRVVRTLVGVYACRRDLAEALAFYLWREEGRYEDWQEPDQEGVPATQPLSNAAD